MFFFFKSNCKITLLQSVVCRIHYNRYRKIYIVRVPSSRNPPSRDRRNYDSDKTNQRIARRLPKAVTWAWWKDRLIAEESAKWKPPETLGERTVHSLFTLQCTWKKKRANGGLGEASELSLFPSPSPLSLPFSAGIQSLAAILFARLTIEQKCEKILGCEQSNRGVPGVIDDDFVFYSRSPARGGSIMPMIFVFRGMFLNTSTMMSSALPHTNWAFVTPAKQHMTLEWITQI